MRSSRLQKYRKRSKGKKLNILLQIMVINYSVVFTGTFIGLPTNALFTDQNVNQNSSFYARAWHHSSLIINAYFDKNARPRAIIVEIYNSDTRLGMREPLSYELYQGPHLVGGGSIPILGPSESYSFSIPVGQTGFYRFIIPHGNPIELNSLFNHSVVFEAEIYVEIIEPTEADLIALEEGLITAEELEAYLNGEMSREELDALIIERTLEKEEKEAARLHYNELLEAGLISQEEFDELVDGKLTLAELEELIAEREREKLEETERAEAELQEYLLLLEQGLISEEQLNDYLNGNISKEELDALIEEEKARQEEVGETEETEAEEETDASGDQEDSEGSDNTEDQEGNQESDTTEDQEGTVESDNTEDQEGTEESDATEDQEGTVESDNTEELEGNQESDASEDQEGTEETDNTEEQEGNQESDASEGQEGTEESDTTEDYDSDQVQVENPNKYAKKEDEYNEGQHGDSNSGENEADSIKQAKSDTSDADDGNEEEFIEEIFNDDDFKL